MNKRIIFLLSAFISIISFTSVFGQSSGLFNELNGRSRQWIERNYPDYKVNPTLGESYDGYYRIDNYQCRGGGYVILMVGFDGYKRPDEVGTVSLYAKGCKELIPHDDFGEAIDLFIEMFGLSQYTDQAEILMNVPGNLTIMFPDKIMFSAHMRYNKNSNFYYFYADCNQL